MLRLAGNDADGPLVVDANGVVWSGLGAIEMLTDEIQLTAETQRTQRGRREDSALCASEPLR